MAEISIYDPKMFVWIDETGCDKRNSQRKYAYSVRGITPRDHRMLIRGTRYSAIGIMALEGILDVHVVSGTVNGERFTHFVTDTLLPVLKPFDGNNPLSVVIMDNASIHHVDDVVDAIENTAHAKVIFLPPYSPDLMPLEEVFSKVKYIIKDNDKVFQSTTMPTALLTMVFGMVTSEDCSGYVHHSGYV